MKNYTIYLKEIDNDPNSKSTKKPTKMVVDKGMELAKTIFLKAIETNIKAKEIVIAKIQPYSDGVNLSVDKTVLEKIILLFRSIDVVLIIDAEYTDPE